MKVILEFDGDTERDELETALKGWKYRRCLDDVWNNVFRPYHKHGYSNERIQEILDHDENGNPKYPEAHELLEFLEARYKETAYDNE